MNGTKLKDPQLKFQNFLKNFPQSLKDKEGRAIKILICILLSNVFLYLLLNMNESPKIGLTYSPTNRPDHAWIEVPLVTHLPLQKHTETLATLLDEQNLPICERIYVSPGATGTKTSSSSKDTWDFTDSDISTRSTLIQVPKDQLMNVVKSLTPGRVFKAVPVMDVQGLKFKGPIRKGREYEIQF